MSVDAKICGINSDAAMDAALDGGARYVGLVFFARSPRNVDLATAARLSARARGRATIVALVVDPDDRQLADIVGQVSPDMIQLHGRETPERTAEIVKLIKRPVMKAIPVASARDADRALQFSSVADLILFDAKPPVVPGSLPRLLPPLPSPSPSGSRPPDRPVNGSARACRPGGRPDWRASARSRPWPWGGAARPGAGVRAGR